MSLIIEKSLSIFLIGSLILGTDSIFVFAQKKTNDNASQAEKIKYEVVKRGIGEKSRIRVKMSNGIKLKGYISGIGEDSFALTDSKTKQSTVIAFRDAARIEGRGLAGGAKIGIIVGAAAGATLLILYAAFQAAIKDN